jgi:sterol desaturase/sphingolipid hydroxylase (fatty acid hydroxylase superfamily)
MKIFNIDPATFRLVLFVAGLVLFLALELVIPYRKPSVSKPKRMGINLGMTVFNAVVLNLIFGSLIILTVTHVDKNNIGFLTFLDSPLWVKVLITVAFFDFMLYIWHLLNHKVPFLWRFHRVHHCDLNMDVSTATRFHVGELAISNVIKVSLVYLLGAPLLGVILFESLVVFTAQFHHSSLKAPRRFENIYWYIFVPPSMHRIHHSVVIKERDSNYATIFSLWDRGMGTLRTDVDQEKIKIGVGAYRKQDKLNLHHLLKMPFAKPIK